jgi:biopolymer transport protein ExbD
MKFNDQNLAEDFRIDLTPLIDVVFNLLIFFMVTTTFVTAAGLDVNLPEASTKSEHREMPDRIVNISNEGQLAYAGKIIEQDQLREEFEKLAAVDPFLPLVIKADKKVHHGRVVAIMDLAKEAGLKKLAIATAAKVRMPEAGVE